MCPSCSIMFNDFSLKHRKVSLQYSTCEVLSFHQLDRSYTRSITREDYRCKDIFNIRDALLPCSEVSMNYGIVHLSRSLMVSRDMSDL